MIFPDFSSRANGLVETDRRFDLALQSRVIENVVVRERLFEHHQIEFVQTPKQIYIVQCIRRICVAQQQNISESFAHSFNHVVIPTRRDFDLYSLITCV